MTLFTFAPSDGPSVHALVIGAGHYPHLARTELGSCLSPVTTPAASACAVARWLALRLNHPTARLATIEVLASTAGGRDVAVQLDEGSPGTVVDAPTDAAVRTAFAKWYDRCDASEENVALFFFCGHGIQNATQLLLLDDVGVDPNDEWNSVVDFDATRRAMMTCRAGSQYFLVDACRTLPLEVALDLDFLGRSLRPQPRRGATDRRRKVVAVRSSMPGTVARGLRNRPSDFTLALLGALNGPAALHQDESGRWVVDWNGLATALPGLLPPDAATVDFDGSMQGALHVLAAPPMVQTTVACTRDVMSVHFTGCGSGRSFVATPLRDHCRTDWECVLPADVYHLTVEWPPQARDAHLRYVLPPRAHIQADEWP